MFTNAGLSVGMGFISSDELKFFDSSNTGFVTFDSFVLKFFVTSGSVPA